MLAVQEVGDPEALEDLREHLEGDWHTETSEFPDGRGIRVGFLSRLALAEVEQLRAFPERLAPCRSTTRAPRWPRWAAAPTCAGERDGPRGRPGHLSFEVEAAEFSRWALPARNEGERARFGCYALYRRASEAVTVRAL